MAALAGCAADLRDQGRGDDVAAVCVDGTSGTVVLLDSENRPLGPGLMHDDGRAHREAAELNSLMANHCEEVGYRFGASFALPKLLWLRRRRPEIFERARRVSHQADYILGVLTGRFGVSDPSNSLKTGYNLVTDRWPDETRDLGLRDLLPEVPPSGSAVGALARSVAEEVGLPASTLVLTGVTDSTAAFLASGASEVGEVVVSLGSTLAFKGISNVLIRDPAGSVYCHRHPGGGWLPGGASNAGAMCLRSFFPGEDLKELDSSAIRGYPSSVLCYPLVGLGERFPFQSSDAAGFFDEASDPLDRYLSLLEGVALVERWCLERIRDLGFPLRAPIYSTGGGSESEVWNRIRADVIGLPVVRCRSADSAFGAAVLAGAMCFHDGNLAAASRAMTSISRRFEPDPGKASWASEMLGRLQERCRSLGWIPGEAGNRREPEPRNRSANGDDSGSASWPLSARRPSTWRVD